jgi:thermostable 8-oxoguanine DNA glycosylase
MKKSEIRKLIANYKEIKRKLGKSDNDKLREKLEIIEHRYYHETGKILKDDLQEIT